MGVPLRATARRYEGPAAVVTWYSTVLPWWRGIVQYLVLYIHHRPNGDRRSEPLCARRALPRPPEAPYRTVPVPVPVPLPYPDVNAININPHPSRPSRQPPISSRPRASRETGPVFSLSGRVPRPPSAQEVTAADLGTEWKEAGGSAPLPRPPIDRFDQSIPQSNRSLSPELIVDQLVMGDDSQSGSAAKRRRQQNTTLRCCVALRVRGPLPDGPRTVFTVYRTQHLILCSAVGTVQDHFLAALLRSRSGQ